MKDEPVDTEKTASACSAKKEENKEKNKEDDQLQVLNEITFFISRFFIGIKDNPTEMDAMQATRLSELVLLFMAQLLERGMRKKREPVFNVTIYVEDMGGGVGKLNYAFETQGGKMFKQLDLSLMGRELEEGIARWCKKTWGGELTTEAADIVKMWSGVSGKPEEL